MTSNYQVGYQGWIDLRAIEADAAPERLEPAALATDHLQVDAELLARLEGASPRLTLESDDGTRVSVAVWRVRGDLGLSPLVGLTPTHDRVQIVDWTDGSVQRFPVNVTVAPANFN